MPGLEVNAWNGILAPRGTPRHIIERLYKAVVAAADRPEFEKELEARGVEKLVLDPKAFGAYIERESAKWARVAKAGKLKAH